MSDFKIIQHIDRNTDSSLFPQTITTAVRNEDGQTAESLFDKINNTLYEKKYNTTESYDAFCKQASMFQLSNIYSANLNYPIKKISIRSHYEIVSFTNEYKLAIYANSGNELTSSTVSYVGVSKNSTKLVQGNDSFNVWKFNDLVFPTDKKLVAVIFDASVSDEYIEYTSWNDIEFTKALPCKTKGVSDQDCIVTQDSQYRGSLVDVEFTMNSGINFATKDMIDGKADASTMTYLLGENVEKLFDSYTNTCNNSDKCISNGFRHNSIEGFVSKFNVQLHSDGIDEYLTTDEVHCVLYKVVSGNPSQDMVPSNLIGVSKNYYRNLNNYLNQTLQFVFENTYVNNTQFYITYGTVSNTGSITHKMIRVYVQTGKYYSGIYCLYDRYYSEKMNWCTNTFLEFYKVKDVKHQLDDKVDKVSGKGLSTNDYTTNEKNKLANVPSNVSSLLSQKVDKVTGKSLSTNDYTTNEKNKLASMIALKTGAYSDLNNSAYKVAGIYEYSYSNIVGPDNHLPITDTSRTTVHGWLIVDNTTGDGDLTTQTFIQANERGSEGKIYIRSNVRSGSSGSYTWTWSKWKEIDGILNVTTDQTSIIPDNYPTAGGGFNNMIDNGRYSGVAASFISATTPNPSTAYTFYLDVINDYFVKSVLGGKRQITQKLFGLPYAGTGDSKSGFVKIRTGIDGDSGIVWGEWKTFGASVVLDDYDFAYATTGVLYPTQEQMTSMITKLSGAEKKDVLVLFNDKYYPIDDYTVNGGTHRISFRFSNIIYFYNLTLTGTFGKGSIPLATQNDVSTGLAGKVDKVSGKGLSTNDYTTAEKEKLASITQIATYTYDPTTKTLDITVQ